MIDGIGVGTLERKAGGIADQAPLLGGQGRTGRGAIGELLRIEPRTLGREIAGLQHQAAGQLLLHVDAPGLRVRNAVIAVDCPGVGDRLSGRRDGEAVDQRQQRKRA